jgi:hypothetical protein
MNEFLHFPKMARYSRDVIVTEKIDGTNAQILITEDGQFFTGSRNRWITPDNDNYGFSKWAHENRDQLMTLGVGRHFGEWWGSGIQRKYGLKNGDKRFSLFNAIRWENDCPECCFVVPVLWRGNFDDFNALSVMEALKFSGSMAAPGFMNPEGIVIYHEKAGIGFKKTFANDDTGKLENTLDPRE